MTEPIDRVGPRSSSSSWFCLSAQPSSQSGPYGAQSSRPIIFHMPVFMTKGLKMIPRRLRGGSPLGWVIFHVVALPLLIKMQCKYKFIQVPLSDELQLQDKAPLFSLSSPKVTQIKCKLCCLIDLWYSAFLYCTHISRTRKRNSKKKTGTNQERSGKKLRKTFQLSLN